MSLVELREYKIRPGKAKEWLNWMKLELLPYQVSQGMVVLETYTYEDEYGELWFVWLRSFESESQRQALYVKTYDDWWVKEIRPKIFEMIFEESINVRLLKPAYLLDRV